MIKTTLVSLKSKTPNNKVTRESFLSFVEKAYNPSDSVQYYIESVAPMANLSVVGYETCLNDPALNRSYSGIYDRQTNQYYDVKIIGSDKDE